MELLHIHEKYLILVSNILVGSWSDLPTAWEALHITTIWGGSQNSNMKKKISLETQVYEHDAKQNRFSDTKDMNNWERPWRFWGERCLVKW